jgi:hypothetical protein
MSEKGEGCLEQTHYKQVEERDAEEIKNKKS